MNSRSFVRPCKRLSDCRWISRLNDGLVDWLTVLLARLTVTLRRLGVVEFAWDEDFMALKYPQRFIHTTKTMNEYNYTRTNFYEPTLSEIVENISLIRTHMSVSSNWRVLFGANNLITSYSLRSRSLITPLRVLKASPQDARVRTNEIQMLMAAVKSTSEVSYNQVDVIHVSE